MNSLKPELNWSTRLLAVALWAPVSLTALSDRAKETIILDAMGEQNLGIETEIADYRDFEETVFVIGRIAEISSSRAVLSSRIAGRVVDLQAFEGDRVEAGQTVVTVESRQLGDPPPQVGLQAPQGGIVVNSHVRLGQPVEPSQELMDIADRSKVWAVAQIPEQQASKVAVGTVARIHVPAFGDGWINAKLARFGVEADPQIGTVQGIFVLDNKEGLLRPGMRVEFSIILEQFNDVLSVPRESVQGDPARRLVFVRDFDLPHAFVRAPLVLGRQNERFVEVLSGLFPGDEVVTRGSYGLSFAGAGAGMSLKEALDAAHGHEHNEDGSEITPEQRAALEREKRQAEGLESSQPSAAVLPLGIYAAVISLLCLILLQRLWHHRSNAEVEKDA